MTTEIEKRLDQEIDWICAQIQGSRQKLNFAHMTAMLLIEDELIFIKTGKHLYERR